MVMRANDPKQPEFRPLFGWGVLMPIGLIFLGAIVRFVAEFLRIIFS